MEDNAIAVKGAALIKRLEDEQIECSLKIVFGH